MPTVPKSSLIYKLKQQLISKLVQYYPIPVRSMFYNMSLEMLLRYSINGSIMIASDQELQNIADKLRHAMSEQYTPYISTHTNKA